MREGVLLALASSPALARGDLAEFHAHARAMAPTPGAAVILYFTTKPMGHANGLGLAQVYGFANQCGGMLRLDSVEGEGTTVEIYLPRAPAGSAGIVALAAAPPAAPAGTARHVLFVDDDTLLRDTVVPALEQAGLRPDVVFSDIVMPGRTSGIALASIVRERFAATGIVLATGYSDQRVGLPDVLLLSKPYELTAVIDALSASKPRENA